MSVKGCPIVMIYEKNKNMEVQGFHRTVENLVN